MSMMMTLILVYTLIKSLTSLDLVKNKYVPIAGMMAGLILGMGISYLMKENSFLENAIVGGFVGSDISRWDDIIKKMMDNVKR